MYRQKDAIIIVFDLTDEVKIFMSSIDIVSRKAPCMSGGSHLELKHVYKMVGVACLVHLNLSAACTLCCLRWQECTPSLFAAPYIVMREKRRQGPSIPQY